MQNNPFPKILIRFPNWLGDIVLALPFLALLLKQNPNAKVVVLIKKEYADILKQFNWNVEVRSFQRFEVKSIFNIWSFVKKNRDLSHFGFYYCLPPSFSSALMGFFFKAKHRVGLSSDWRSLLLTDSIVLPKNRPYKHRSSEYLFLLERKFVAAPNLPLPVKLSKTFQVELPEKYWVINVNSEASSRRLPIEQWQIFLNQFNQKNFVFIGTNADKERVESVLGVVEGISSQNTYWNMAGKTNLLELMQVLQGSQGIISNDSGPAHLAALFNKPVMVFFGAGEDESTRPLGEKVMVIRELGLACAPCLKNICPRKDNPIECLKNLPMEEYARVIASLR